MKKKLLALLLVVVMIVSLVPVSAFAASEYTCPDCGGTETYIKRRTCSLGMQRIACAACDKDLTVETVNPGVHPYVDGVCPFDGEVDPDYVEPEVPATTQPHVHDYNILGEKATCQYAAYYYCECGAGKEVGYPDPEAHTYVDGVCACGAEEPVEECAHENTKENRVDPSCVKEGSKQIICKDCDAVVSVETLPADTVNGHAFLNGKCLLCSAVEEAGCNHVYANGDCTICGETHDHETTKVEAVAATCTEWGMIEYYTCAGCECNFYDAEGEKVLFNLFFEKIAPTGHDYMNGDCMNCGETHDHETTKVEAVAPTCTEWGMIEYYTCAGCECNFYDAEGTKVLFNLFFEKIAPTGHSYFNGVCEICGAECEHDIVAVEAAELETCQDWGLPAYYTCANECGANFYDANGKDRIVNLRFEMVNGPHNFVDGVCEYCGEEKTACDHDYVIVKENMATCDAPGYIWTKCSICGNEYNYETEAIGGEHDYVVVKEDKATCDADGYVWTKCSKCGNEYNHATDAIGGEHDYVVVKENKATCDANGYVWTKCSKCGNEYNHETEALGGEHNYEIVKEQEANCAEGGYVWTKCSICGNEWNYETEPATGVHGDTKLDIVLASCVKTGVQKVICKVCDEVLSEEVLPVDTVNGHAFLNGKCLLCGAPDCAHDGETKLDIVLASCVKEGVQKVICKNCDTVISEEVLPVDAVNGHAFLFGSCLLCGAPDCDHDGETKLDIVLASCVKEGVQKVICKNCDTVISEEVLPVDTVNGHAFLNGACLLCGAPDCAHDGDTKLDIILPSCVKTGVQKVICKACDTVLSEELLPVDSVNGHAFLKGVCLLCGIDEISACEHDYVVVKELAGTCVEPGYVWTKCSKCGNEYNHETVADAAGHSYINGDCELCGETCAHEIVEVPADELADCSEWGVRAHYACSICDAKFNDAEGAELIFGIRDLMVKGDHQYANGDCMVCGETHDHEIVAVEGDELADCSKWGVADHFACTGCDAKFYDAEGEKLIFGIRDLMVNGDHAYENGKCTVCGEADPDYVAEPELDDVPKTGDNTAMVLATMTVFALLSAMAFVFGKKRSAC